MFQFLPHVCFSSPDAPPNKVKVTSEERDNPRPISPPAQLENPTYSATSPPLPALVKKMEHHDLDNPFRPQENLYHEVDPIVEAYKNRPFPPSPVGSPIPHENHASTTTPQHNSTQNAHETSHISRSSTPQKTPTHPGNVRATEKRNSETVHITDVDALLPAADLPPPNKAEVVHLEKRKKCACCSVQ